MENEAIHETLAHRQVLKCEGGCKEDEGILANMTIPHQLHNGPFEKMTGPLQDTSSGLTRVSPVVVSWSARAHPFIRIHVEARRRTGLHESLHDHKLRALRSLVC